MSLTASRAPLRWADRASPEFATLDRERAVAVLPLGATEQHGPHLPLCVDTAIAEAVLARACAALPETAPVLVLPTQAVGYSPEHAGFAGTLTLPYDTVLATWIAIGRCVLDGGVRKLLLFNAHGGQAGLVNVAARELRTLGMAVWGCNWWDLPLGDAGAAFSADEHRFGVHAGQIETALMLALDPSQVRADRLRDFSSAARDRAGRHPVLGRPGVAKLGWHMQDYNPEGATGNAAAADAAQGHALLAQAGMQLAALLGELSALPLAELLREPPRA